VIPLEARLVDDISRSGPITVADFMERALYDPDHGYYTTAERRSGRGGDFFTSVDVGPLFGRLLAGGVARLWAALAAQYPARARSFDLVEAGGGRGQLLADVLDGLRDDHPDCYAAARAVLVERSEPARRSAAERLQRHAARLAEISPDAAPEGLQRAIGADLPERISGIVFANELLDAFPVHRLVGRGGRLVERWVGVTGGRLAGMDGPISSEELNAFVARTGLQLGEGGAVDVNLQAGHWLDALGQRLTHGYAVVIDYGSLPRPGVAPRLRASLRAFERHRLVTDEAEPWLGRPGARDLTADVAFDLLTDVARGSGWIDLGLRSQATFLLSCGLEGLLTSATGTSVADVRTRLAAQALVGPGGPGEAHAVWVLGRGVGLQLPV
jgi:SAM-dependent MidA family methyltransferase